MRFAVSPSLPVVPQRHRHLEPRVISFNLPYANLAHLPSEPSFVMFLALCPYFSQLSATLLAPTPLAHCGRGWGTMQLCNTVGRGPVLNRNVMCRWETGFHLSQRILSFNSNTHCKPLLQGLPARDLLPMCLFSLLSEK